MKTQNAKPHNWGFLEKLMFSLIAKRKTHFNILLSFLGG
jgi:hypothetical protein